MKRFVSGILMGAAAVALVGWAPRWVWFLVLVALGTLALNEFFELAEKCGLHPFRMVGFVFGLALFALQLFYWVRWEGALLACFVLVVLVVVLLRPHQFPQAIASASTTVFGTFYVAGFLSLLLAWSGPDSSGLSMPSPFNSRAAVFFLLAVIWASDIAAFYTGRLLGRQKLAPKISPGKTIEGSVGGWIGSLIVAVVFQKFWMPTSSLAGIVVLATCLNAAGVLGDLAESAMKRGAGVKDSSTLIPGHGGTLDRIDSLLFAIPVMFYYPSIVAFLKRLLAGA
ncbi:MAG: phosphatidate cytidylyltransferase [Acidobacteriia bacterium]|nr:phosphatidate cytidylyltransferase [Terriglobia bacterium]